MFQRTSISLISLLLLSFGTQVIAASKAELNQAFRDCLSETDTTALSSCENYVGFGGTEMRAFLKLGKLYRQRKEFAKAERVYELALKFNSESSSLKTKLKRSRSNSEEQAWMAANTQAALTSSSATAKADRLTCVKMARVRPQKAMDACNRLVAAGSGDAAVQKAIAVAAKKLGGNTQTAVAASSSDQQIQLAAASNVLASGTTTTRSSSGQNMTTTESSDAVKSEDVIKVASAAPAAVANEASGVDSKTIEEIKADLAKIYSLVQEQKSQPAAVAPEPQAIGYKETGKRHALVIGVSDYPDTLGALKNPANDATDIAETLESLGFTIELSVNSGLREMEEIIARFSRKLGPDDTAMFYYAGHGVQIDGENYLIPAGVEITDEVDIKYKSVNLSYILEKIQSRGKGVNLVVLDACRDNPFGKSRSASGPKGWATVNGPVGTLIAYATAPGQVASDGAGDNGVYTKHLISQMTKPGIKVEDVFKGVRIAVDEETGGEQIPWENSSLIGDFYFSVKG